MEVCNDGAAWAPDGRIGSVLVLLRRVGVVLGVLFGLGLIAVMVAERSAAEERDGAGSAQPAAPEANGTSQNGVLGGLTRPLIKPVSDVVEPLAEVVKPVEKSVVAPVAEVVTEPLAPLVRPLAEALAPVTEPVLGAVAAATGPVLDPVLDSVAPVLDAAEPVVVPVTGASGLDEVAESVAGDLGRQDGATPVDRAPAAAPVLPWPNLSDGPWHGATAAGSAESVLSESAASESVRSGSGVAPVSPDPRPAVPGVPVQHAVTGGSSVGGSGGAHGADGVFGSDGVTRERVAFGRSPPGTIDGVAWFAYDDRDHPS